MAACVLYGVGGDQCLAIFINQPSGERAGGWLSGSGGWADRLSSEKFCVLFRNERSMIASYGPRWQVFSCA